MKYEVGYRMASYGMEQKIIVDAKSKTDAYDKAVYTIIRKITGGRMPYSAWVESVTYSNGKVHAFNTSEGNPY